MTSEITEFATKAYAAWHGPDQDLAGLRAGFDTMHPEPPADVTVTEANLGGTKGRWVSTPESGDAVVIHVHGGAFMLGSSFGYREFASRIARAAAARVLLPDYRLAPEHQCPAASDDVVRVYRALLADGVDPASVVVAGDSAGGNIALAAIVTLKKAGDRLPAGVVLLSPVADLTLSGDSMTTLAAQDPISTRAAAEQGVGLYLPPDIDAADDRASAMFADLSGLPPLLVQAGTHEILLDDAIRVAENARNAGVEVDLQLSYQMTHVFQTFAYRFEEAQRAVDRIGGFVRRNVSAAR
ncbi:alpha/beta hydrolase [Mycobacterium syngnathidarum]